MSAIKVSPQGTGKTYNNVYFIIHWQARKSFNSTFTKASSFHPLFFSQLLSTSLPLGALRSTSIFSYAFPKPFPRAFKTEKSSFNIYHTSGIVTAL